MVRMIGESDVADWFNCRSQTSFTILFLIRIDVFLITVYKQNNCDRNVSLFIGGGSKAVL